MVILINVESLAFSAVVIDCFLKFMASRIFIATELINETYVMSGVHTFFMSMLRSNGIIVYPYTSDDDELLVNKLVKQTEPSFPILRCTDVVLHSGKSRRSNDKIILQPGVWEAKLNVHQEYCDQFKRAAFCLMLVHRFGVSKIIACCVHPSPTSSPSSLPSSSSHISSQYQFKFSAVELIPAELWQLVCLFIMTINLSIQWVQLIKKCLSQLPCRYFNFARGLGSLHSWKKSST